MSTGHMSVQCIELLHRGCTGHWGMYGYMHMGCYTQGGWADNVYLCQLKRPGPLSSQKENLAAKPQAKYGETDVLIPTNTLHSHEAWRRIIVLNNVANTSNFD